MVTMKKYKNAVKRKNCFFCTSPFQLFSIISIANSYKGKSDLYIDPQFNNAKEYAIKIKEQGIFANVYVIDSEIIYDKFFTYKKGILNRLQKARTYLKVNDIVSMIIVDNVIYNDIFISSKAYIPRLVYLWYIKNKIKAHMHYFDDGVGSYFADNAYTPKKLDSVLRRILFGKESLRMDYDRYLLFPLFYKKLNPEFNYIIREVPIKMCLIVFLMFHRIFL